MQKKNHQAFMDKRSWQYSEDGLDAWVHIPKVYPNKREMYIYLTFISIHLSKTFLILFFELLIGMCFLLM